MPRALSLCIFITSACGADASQQQGSAAVSAPRAISVSPSENRSIALQWTIERAEQPEALNAVWGSGPDDIYAVGDGDVILHSRGDGVWRPLEDPPKLGVSWVSIWGSSAVDVHILSDGGWRLHSTDGGQHWQRLPTWEGLQQVTGTTAEDYFLGPEHTRDGGRSFHGSPASRVWAVDDAVFSFLVPYSDCDQIRSMTFNVSDDRGRSWRSVEIGPVCYHPTPVALWGSSQSDVYLLWPADEPLHWNGKFLEGLPIAEPTHDAAAIWGSGPDDIWIVGDAFSIRHMQHLGVNVATISFPSRTEDLRAVWGSGRDDVYMVGSDGIILHAHR